jgi:UDP-N-acetylmuramoyl-tripeptide--D-alanyl-D-alanine ligase
MRVAKTKGNLNNQIGLPLTLLAASGDEDAWVVELGISRPGDMAELAPVAAPDIAVVHNIGPAHLEGLGSLAGVATEKTELLRHLAPGGQAFASQDYPELWAAAQEACPDVVAMSARDETVAYSCIYLGQEGPAEGRFRLSTPLGQAEAVLPMTGQHAAENLAAVGAVAACCNIGPETLLAAVAGAEIPAGRFQIRELGPHLLIDDSYNANPLSMARSIEAVVSMAKGKDLILILGDMLELGSAAAQEHLTLGRLAAVSKAKLVAHVGGHANDVEQGLSATGFSGDFARLQRPQDITTVSLPAGPLVILVKGSRSCRLEDYAAVLEERLSRAKEDAA